MNGIAFLLLFVLLLGFLAGYRYAKGLGTFHPKSTRTALLGRAAVIGDVARIDPVCNKVVLAGQARTCVYRESVYYFCSPTCRATFEEAPKTYADPDSMG